MGAARREDGRGRCEHCAAEFPFELVHGGFADSAHAYCDRCGVTAIVGLAATFARVAKTPRSLAPLPRAVERLLAPCACGGAFRGRAAARCPACRAALSARKAAEWVEARAATGFRWQRSWVGLYAVILGERVVFDPWRP